MWPQSEDGRVMCRGWCACVSVCCRLRAGPGLCHGDTHPRCLALAGVGDPVAAAHRRGDTFARQRTLRADAANHGVAGDTTSIAEARATGIAGVALDRTAGAHRPCARAIIPTKTLLALAGHAAICAREEVGVGAVATLAERARCHRGHTGVAERFLPDARPAAGDAVARESAECSVLAEHGPHVARNDAAILNPAPRRSLQGPSALAADQSALDDLRRRHKRRRKHATVAGLAGGGRRTIEDLPVAGRHQLVTQASTGVAARTAIAADARRHFELDAALQGCAEVDPDHDWVDDTCLDERCQASAGERECAGSVEPLEDKRFHFSHLWPLCARVVTRKRMPCSRRVRGIHRACQVITCAMWCLAVPSQVDAQQPHAVAVFEAPAECPTRETLEATIAANLGQAPPANIVDVVILRRGAGFSSTVTFHGGDSRTLEGETCAGLVRALALIVAIQIDPDAMFRVPPELPIDPPNPPTIPAERPLAELEGALDEGREVPPDSEGLLSEPFGPAGRRRDEPAGRFLLGGALTLEVGAMPGVSAGAWLGGTARIGILEIGVEARFQPESFSPLPQRPAIGAIVSLIAGRARVGVAIALGELGPLEFEVAPLLSLELGALSARGAGLLAPIGASSLWVALAPGAELRGFFLEHFGLFIRAELEIALLRSPFVIAGYSSPAFLASPAGLTSLVGILLRTN